LVEYLGDVISGDENDRRYPKDALGVYCLKLSASVFIDSALSRGVGAAANAPPRGTRPNLKFVSHAASKSARLEVVRHVDPGDELFVSYGDEYWQYAAKAQHHTVDVPDWEWDLSDPFATLPLPGPVLTPSVPDSPVPAAVAPPTVPSVAPVPEALHFLRGKGVHKLYHFTDVSALSSIQEHGLQSWVALDRKGIAGRRGSSALSRELDKKKGLGDFVRLSFTPRHPMMYTATKDGRLAEAVVLEVDLDVVSGPGVLFSDRNAASSDAIVSPSASVVHWDIVLRRDQFAVSRTDRRFFQAEVLVPSAVSRVLVHCPAGQGSCPCSCSWPRCSCACPCCTR